MVINNALPSPEVRGFNPQQQAHTIKSGLFSIKANHH